MTVFGSYMLGIINPITTQEQGLDLIRVISSVVMNILIVWILTAQVNQVIH